MYSYFIKLKELLNILSFQKIRNLALVYFGYAISRLFRKSVVLGQPYSISYEPTTACNLSCPECPTGKKEINRNKGMLSLADFDRTLDELSPNLLHIIFYFQGEPFLNPSLPDFIRRARYKKVFTMTSTNGHFLTPETAEKVVAAGLHRLIISVDGAEQQTYAMYRKGGDLKKVMQGIENIEEAKRKQKSVFPEVEIQFLVFRTNQHQLPDMRQLAKNLGVKLQIKSAQIYNYEQAHNLVPTIQKYARYKKTAEGSFVLKSKLPNRCWRLWSSAVLTWNGHVVPCCFDKNAEHKQGQLPESTFSSVWKGERYSAFRQQILHSRKSVDICKNCTEGLRM